jgi:hypothetical protein
VRTQRLTPRIGISEHLLGEDLVTHDRAEVGDEDLRQRLLARRQEDDRSVLTEHSELVDTRVRVRSLVLRERVQPGTKLLVGDRESGPVFETARAYRWRTPRRDQQQARHAPADEVTELF